MASLASLGAYTDMQVGKLLASFCVILYLIVFGVFFLLGSANGTSFETMIALGGPETSDVTEYVHLAENMLTVGRFEISSAFGPEYLRVPGYPAFLALMLAFFGTLTVVPFVQIIFTAGTVALIYLIGVRYFPRPIAIAAAVIYTIDPVIIYSTWVPISEPLFILSLLGSIYCVGTPARRAWVPYVLAGLLFGISVYMRPVGLYLAPLLALLAFANAVSWKTAARGALIFLVVTAATIVPWMMRNYSLSGHFAFSPSSAFNLYFANMPTFEQARTGVSYEQIRREYNEKYFGTQEEDILRSFKYAGEQLAIAREVILAHPFQYAAFHTAKSMQLFIGSSIVNTKYHLYRLGILPGERPHGEGAWGMILQGRLGDAFVQTFTNVPRLIERLLWLLLYLGMLYTTYRALRYRDSTSVWIVVAFLFIHAIAFMTGPSSDDTRYRMPLEPFLLLLGIYGIYLATAQLWNRFRRNGADVLSY
ncbi:glycosyltransferase family 39 protein [Candidatus Kaiserbacteria bacterium]|nr:glycosyltransferase family 39 protein [Candidatus Kaiserbacteria bacterium]